MWTPSKIVFKVFDHMSRKLHRRVAFYRSSIFAEHLSTIASVVVVILILNHGKQSQNQSSLDEKSEISHVFSWSIADLGEVLFSAPSSVPYILPMSFSTKIFFEYLNFLGSFNSTLSCSRFPNSFFYEMVELNCYL